MGTKVFFGGLMVLWALPAVGVNGTEFFGGIITVLGYILILLDK